MHLFRPVGLEELRLIAESGFLSFPPRLPEQPIFYPVTSVEYARQIASDWNTKAAPYAGFVTAFDVDDAVAASYPVQTAGSRAHHELWVPANELAAFNEAIQGPIRVLEAYVGQASSLEIDPHSNLPADWTYPIVYQAKTAEEVVSTYGPSDERRIRFAWNGQHGEQFEDSNAGFRNEVLVLLVGDIQAAPDKLVRDLYLAVTESSREAWAIDTRASLLAQSLLCRSSRDYLQDYMHGASQSFDAGLATAAIILPAEVTRACLDLLEEGIENAATVQERDRLSFFCERFRTIRDHCDG